MTEFHRLNHIVLLFVFKVNIELEEYIKLKEVRQNIHIILCIQNEQLQGILRITSCGKDVNFEVTMFCVKHLFNDQAKR